MKNISPPLRVAVFLLSIVFGSSALAAPPAKPTLLQLAKDKFAPRPLTEAEEKLFLATEKGVSASMLTGDQKNDDPATADGWSPGRTISSESLRWLCIDPEASGRITHRGIWIEGMRIVGTLDLSHAKMEFPFTARNCSWTGDLLLADARLRSLVLRHCFIEGLDASRAHIDGDAVLEDGCEAKGEVSFKGAIIERSLNCSGGCFGKGLDAEWAQIRSEVFLRAGFYGQGGVRFGGANIGGSLNCEGSEFINPDGSALTGDKAKIAGDVLFRTSQAEGEVSFIGATIEHILDLDGSRLSNPKGWAFQGGGAKIGGDVFARNGFQATGEVSLIGATIGGNLELDGARLMNPGGTALMADRANIGGNAYLRPWRDFPFTAEGEVNFLGAVIGGSLECDCAQLTNPGGNALRVDRTKIGAHVFVRNGFTGDGMIDFNGAEISGSFIWLGVRITPNTFINFRSAKLGAIKTDATICPPGGQLELDGLVYNRVHDDEASAEPVNWEHWLSLQRFDKFYPQPYEQLASVLRSMGREREARDIMIAKNVQYRRFTETLSPEWWWYNVFGKLIGYGYRPGYAFLMSLGMIAIGAALFRAGYSAGIISPTDTRAYAKSKGTPAANDADGNVRRPISKEYPRFNALIYSLESFTPFLSLGQNSHWTPNAHRGKRRRVWKFNFPPMGSLLRVYLWAHIIAGWILTSLWIGSVTGLVKT